MKKKKDTTDQEVQGADGNKSVREIDVDKIDLERMKDRTTDLPALLDYAHSIGGFSIVPTQEGVIKGHAMNAMKEQTEMQMQQIYDQMKLLASQAQKLKRRGEISIEIYEAQMSFKPDIGQTYYLYQKKNKKILSLVGPEEWGKSMPFDAYLATVKLLADHTWDVLDDASESEQESED